MLIYYHVVTLISIIQQQKKDRFWTFLSEKGLWSQWLVYVPYKGINEIVEAALLGDVMENVKYMMERLERKIRVVL